MGRAERMGSFGKTEVSGIGLWTFSDFGPESFGFCAMGSFGKKHSKVGFGRIPPNSEGFPGRAKGRNGFVW
jgi:hypothetical protein